MKKNRNNSTKRPRSALSDRGQALNWAIQESEKALERLFLAQAQGKHKGTHLPYRNLMKDVGRAAYHMIGTYNIWRRQQSVAIKGSFWYYLRTHSHNRTSTLLTATTLVDECREAFIQEKKLSSIHLKTKPGYDVIRQERDQKFIQAHALLADKKAA